MDDEEKDKLSPQSLFTQEAIELLSSEFGIPSMSYAVASMGVWVWYEQRITMTAMRLSSDEGYPHIIAFHSTPEMKEIIDRLLSDLEIEYDFLAQQEETSIERILFQSRNVFEIPLFDLDWATKHMNYLAETSREATQTYSQFIKPFDELEKIDPRGALRLLYVLANQEKNQNYVSNFLRGQDKSDGFISQSSLKDCRRDFSEMNLLNEQVDEGPRPKTFLIITPKGRRVAEKVKEILDILSE
jgi:hypothetical protein